MKKLLFIDNDELHEAKHDVEHFIIPFLEAYGGLTKEQASAIEIIPDLYKEDKNKLYNLFYSGNYAIITWTVYAPTSYSNSRKQLINFMAAAGSSSRVKDIIYVDMSGLLEKELSSIIQYEDIQRLFSVLKAIETNYILTLVDGSFFRLRLDLANNKVFRKEVVDLKQLIEK